MPLMWRVFVARMAHKMSEVSGLVDNCLQFAHVLQCNQRPESAALANMPGNVNLPVPLTVGAVTVRSTGLIYRSGLVIGLALLFAMLDGFIKAHAATRARAILLVPVNHALQSVHL